MKHPSSKLLQRSKSFLSNQQYVYAAGYIWKIQQAFGHDIPLYYVIIHPCNYAMCFQPFYGTGPHPLLWAGSRALRGKIITGVRNCVNYCEIFMVHTQFTNVPAGRIIQPGTPPVGDPCFRSYYKSSPVPSFTHRNFLFKSLRYFPLPTTTTYAYGVKVTYSVQIFLPK